MIRYTNLPFRHDDEVIVTEDADGFFPLKDTQSDYTSRMQLACVEYNEFKKSIGSIGLNYKNFYDSYIDVVNDIATKYNVKQKSISNLCRI